MRIRLPSPYSAGRIAAALAVAGLVALASLPFTGVGVDAERWREPIAAALSRAAGRPVHLDGPARLTFSLRPAVRVGRVRIANPSAFDAPEFARIEDVHVVIELLPLLHNEVRVSELRGLLEVNGVIEGTVVSGELALDTSGPRPKVTGRLVIPRFDALPFLARSPGAAATEAKTLAEAFQRLERIELDLQRLLLLDADVEVHLGHLAGVPGEIRDLDTRILVDAGKLAAPLAATIAGARFQGGISADATGTSPRLRAHLSARSAPLGGLAELLFDAPYVAGGVRRFEIALDAQGRSLGDLARDLEARIDIEGAKLTYGNLAGARPVAMRLDAAAVRQLRGKTIVATLRGSLRGKPFAGTFRAGRVDRILREQRTPFHFEGTSGSVRARLSGSLAEPADATGPEIAVDVTAPRASELAPWVGFSSRSEAAVAFKGTVQVRRRDASLTRLSLALGRTSITGDVRWQWQTLAGRALVKADLAAEVLAPAEVREIAGADVNAQRATLLEIPILPESLDFADSDIALRVRRVEGVALEIADVVFQGRMRGGVVTPSPFSLRVEANMLAGALALDARGAAPIASIWAAGEGIDLGAVMRRLRLARDVDLRIGALQFYAQVRDRRLGNVLEQSSFIAAFESGSLDLRDANRRAAALHLSIDAGEVRADPGAPITATATGTAGSLPVALDAQTGGLRELLEPNARLPFSITASSPGVRLALSGSAVPQRDPDVELSLALDGERLDRLDTIFETSLPPWGPYALSARLRFSARGYALDAMRLTLGSSVLEGEGSFDTSLTPPKFSGALAAERIQLKDFPLRDWSPFRERTAPSSPMTLDSARQSIAAGARGVHAMFSREVLARNDAALDVVAKQVVSGDDDLGSGHLHLEVAHGRAVLAPVAVDGGAGTAQGSLAYEPREQDVVVAARVKMDQFDYGRLARVVRPKNDIDGVLSLDFRLDATAPQLSEALASGSGRFDFTVWPQRITGGVIDLWAMNLLLRLLPFVDTSASPMNCVAGQFNLEHGKLQTQRLVIDTVNTRTEGSGTLDFASGAFNLRFAPRPKVPQFFGLATPVAVNGTFEDYRFSARPADVLGTAARWVASPFVVPFQRLTGTRIPPDGHDVCINPDR